MASAAIMVKYSFEANKIEIIDWFYRDFSRTCYLAFKITDKNKIPVIKDIIS